MGTVQSWHRCRGGPKIRRWVNYDVVIPPFYRGGFRFIRNFFSDQTIIMIHMIYLLLQNTLIEYKMLLCFICPQLAQFVLCTRLVPAQTLKLFYTWSIFFSPVILPKEHTPRMIKNNVGFHTTPPIGTYAVGICCIRIMKIKLPIFHSDPQHFVVVNFQPWHSWGAKKKP